jgi:hypothetical protein
MAGMETTVVAETMAGAAKNNPKQNPKWSNFLHFRKGTTGILPIKLSIFCLLIIR